MNKDLYGELTQLKEHTLGILSIFSRTSQKWQLQQPPKIDLFTDMAAIMNLSDLRSIMGEYQILLMPPGHPITLLNPLSRNSDYHQFSPNDIHTMSRD